MHSKSEGMQGLNAASSAGEPESAECLSGGDGQSCTQPLIAPRLGGCLSKPRWINHAEKEETTCIDELLLLRFSPLRAYVVTPLASICTCMVLAVCLFWYPALRARMFYTVASSLRDATHVRVLGRQGNIEVCKLYSTSVETGAKARKETFQYRFIQFEYNQKQASFQAVIYPARQRQRALLANTGIQSADLPRLQKRYGTCQLTVPKKSLPSLLIQEVLNPFYIFQVFSMALWFWDGYEKYAVCILFVSAGGVAENLYETTRNINSIRKLAKYECQITVRRSDEVDCAARCYTVSSDELVPGDVVKVPDNCLMPCDAVLLTGSCIVNESMLTGESVPVIKNAVQAIEEFYEPEHESATKTTLYAGTKVIQAREVAGQAAYALVTRTGFVTTKGTLVRDVLYPQATKFKFYRDALIFVGLMALVALGGFALALPKLVRMGTTTEKLIDKSLDLLTVTVPPALPATMTAGVAFAIHRLKKCQIFCISPPRVNVSGMIQIMVFDKTGTLTEDGMEILGVRSATGSTSDSTEPKFTEFASSIRELSAASQLHETTLRSNLLNEAMGCCHSLTFVDGELLGDPLEGEMFGNTDWILEEENNQNSLIGGEDIVLATLKHKPQRQEIQATPSRTEPIRASMNKTSTAEPVYTDILTSQREPPAHLLIVKRFDFESKLQRMSVIAKHVADGTLRAYVKGSPEKIAELCVPQSLPANYQEILSAYTSKGLRVIALAHRVLADQTFLQIFKAKRDKIECDLHFIGLLVMENKLKGATTKTIETLNTCKIRTIMATGDNTLTAISVAKECNILDITKPVYFSDVSPEGKLVWELTQDTVSTVVTDEVDHEKSKLIQTKENDLEEILPWEMQPTREFGVALNGKSLGLLATNQDKYHGILERILHKASVYARMSPDDKAVLVELLQDTMKTQIGMCGDGANDCGALKQADAGISLSEAEASIAAPFTSKVKDISCVITLLREGRAALATTFQAFKFIELYSLIQFFAVTFLYLKGSNLSDNQFLGIDIAVLVPLCIFQSWTGAWPQLTHNVPQESLFSVPVLTSVLGMAAIQGAFTFYVQDSTEARLGPSYIKCVPSTSLVADDPPCSANTVLYLFTSIQYITTCLVFSVSKPFRKHIWTNPAFLFSVIILSSYQVFLTLSPDAYSADLFALVPLPQQYRYELFGLICANCLCSYLWELLLRKWLY